MNLLTLKNERILLSRAGGGSGPMKPGNLHVNSRHALVPI